MSPARALLLGLIALVATSLPMAVLPEEAEAWDFGSTPFDDVVHAAGQHARCGLTQRQLAAMVIAVTYPEAGSTAARTSPSPMALSRWDNQTSLYSFANTSTFRTAFWHAGVGMFQFDSAGGWPMNAAQRINTASSANQAAATMAQRYCSTPSRSFAWAPWFGCGDNVCENIYREIYDPALDRTRNITRDFSVGRMGGMLQRTCSAPGRGSFTCWYVDPERAQGTRTFLLSHFGPAPVSAPFYTYTHNGREERHWLRADTGYSTDIRASKPLTANARTSLSWASGEMLCDRTADRGACSEVGSFTKTTVNMTGAMEPLVGDFNGNGRSTVFLYQRNGQGDRLLGFADNGALSVAAHPVSGTTYRPFVGDLDGNGQDDIFWYAPGAAPDYVWFGRSDGGFNSYRVGVDGNYQSLVGDFDGDGRSDVLWYAPGPARDYVWFGRSGGSYASREVSVDGNFRPFVGDFDGSGRDAVLWYAPGAARDYVWFGNQNRSFTSREVSVDGNYRPFVGDFDGNGRDDIFWYVAGSAGTWIWYGNAGRTFTSSSRHSVTGDYATAAGAFWGASESIVWNGGNNPSYLWTHRGGRAYDSSRISVAGSSVPVIGDFNGNGRDDIFWYGTSQSRLWQSS